ncbi:MAG: arsenical pump-driving ATPase [Deltaproteobacteria bacterium]|nr:arsenical pump-driving ATPase [Deltaproteobacteria bacterium]
MLMETDTGPRNLFFTGKGGVGKTSAACAQAVELADRGLRVLLVSTDPASNLDEVLGLALDTQVPTAVAAVPGLWALNIDPEAAAAAYRERVVGPVRGLLPAATVANIVEQLSGACTTEIAAFDQFAHLLGDPTATRQFDRVVFDTAPTGHTLRLLELPAAWTDFLESNTTGATCLGPLSGLKVQRQVFATALQALRDPAQTLVVLVARAEPATLREASRTASELSALGIHSLQLLLNGVFRDPAHADPLAQAWTRRTEQALASIPENLQGLATQEVPLLAQAPLGLPGLRAFAAARRGQLAEAPELAPTATDPLPGAELAALVDELAAAGSGVVLTMGKGGVGKTSVAVALARALVTRGLPVHLTTTDPAAHVLETLGAIPQGLRVSRIDPAAEVRRYCDDVMATSGAHLDAQGRALLAEELRSPCTEEIAVFRAFAEVVAKGEREIVLIDTAPTGHTLLLLDAAQAYHRDVQRTAEAPTPAVQNLLPRLRNSDFARVLLVTVAEATPVHEAAQLQADLQRAGIAVYAWVVNQVLSGLPVTHPLLRARQANERKYLREIEALSQRMFRVPFALAPQSAVAAAAQAAR